MRWTKYLAVVIVVAAVGIVVGFFIRTPRANAPVNSTTNSSSNTNSIQLNSAFSTADLPDRDARFAFEVSIPDSWAAEYDAAATAVTFYLPSTSAVQMVVKLGSTAPTGAGSTTINGAYWLHRTDNPVAKSLPSWLGETHEEAWLLRPDAKNLWYQFSFGPTISDQLAKDIVVSLKFNQDLPTNQTTLE